MVHASLRAIGPVEDGAAGVVRALDAAVGAAGTLMMVLGADDPWAWVNERPEAERAALLASAEPFDPLATPAEADVGALAEVFRTTSGTLVSNHPEGRFGARGAGAGRAAARRALGRLLRPGIAAGPPGRARRSRPPPRRRHQHRHRHPLRRIPGRRARQAPGEATPPRRRRTAPAHPYRGLPGRQHRHRRLAGRGLLRHDPRRLPGDRRGLAGRGRPGRQRAPRRAGPRRVRGPLDDRTVRADPPA